MIRRITSLAFLLSALQCVACENAADQQKKVDQAQAQALEKVQAAQKEAEKKIAKAEDQAEKKTIEATNQFDAMHERFRSKTKADLDTLDRKIGGLEAKAPASTGRAKLDLDEKLTQIRAARLGVGTDLRALDASPPIGWDAARAQLEKSVTNLTSLVDKAT